MRIVSQDRTADMPYEMISILQCDNRIYADCPNGDFNELIGVYQDWNHASYVCGDITDSYVTGHKVYEMPSNEKVARLLERCTK